MDTIMVLIRTRLLCTILACLAIGVRSSLLPQPGNPSIGRVSVTKANVVPLSIKSLTSFARRSNQIPLGSPKEQNLGKPHFRVPSVNPSSSKSRPSQNRHPVIAFHSSGLNNPSALDKMKSPVSFFANIPSHSSQAVPLFIHHTAGAGPTAVAVGPTRGGQIHTSVQSLFNDPSFNGPMSPIKFMSQGAASGIQGSSQHNSPNPVSNHGRNTPTASPSGQNQNLPLNFPTSSSVPVAGRSVNQVPATLISGAQTATGLPVGDFLPPTAAGLSVGDFLPPGWIR